MNSFKAKIISTFSMYGFTLRSEALKYIHEQLENINESQIDEVIQSIIDQINSQNLTCSLIEKSHLEEAFQNLDCTSNNDGDLLKIFDAFSLIRFTYNIDSKKFLTWSTLHKKPVVLHGNPDSKADMLIERYKTVHQRTARHRLFSAQSIVSSANQSQNYTLKAVEHLLGLSCTENNIIVLGMLTQLKEGQFFLEDPTGVVPLNLSKTVYKGGLFTENNIVLVEGFSDDKVFHVTAMGFPPPEPAEETLSYFPNFCATPCPTINSHRLSIKLREIEEENSNAMFVFLSDIWLDQFKVMQKLQVLFAGYSQMPPTCFVLIGNFLSLPIVGSQSKVFEDCFSQLGSLISEYPTLIENSQFIFVPGPNDPGLPYILPRPPIPDTFLGDFMKKVPKAIFTSNPCRIQYCSQDIVIFREDIISKLCRNSIYTPWEHEEKVDIPNLFVKTVIANAHLMPLPNNVAPIYWEYDHSLWLYPLPDVVVCADKYDPYTVKSTSSIFFNPGSLPRSNYSFKVYFPASKEVEDSEISDEAMN
ncbi:DNA polymerase epsilon subunit 2 [Parasteatoda tepidariorum]|uniref:DNA polymerase epsilon subunit 2 n=1 Tax=Parasteatoda tepidariorum TaxID=114398 RepID=UPI000A2C04B2|nr:DNA polymerase epsilon subunit 2 [Parasteatoda tepidariorum]